MNDLVVLLGDKVAGHLISDEPGRVQLIYAPDWLVDPLGIPLSLNLPSSSDRHNGNALLATLWGLLPDSEHTLHRWASRFHVSPRNVLGLLANVGEDCAGAVRFVRPERLDAVLQSDEDDVQWLSDEEVALRLRYLRNDSGAGRKLGDIGQFTLAGAQAKTALHRDAGRQRWGVPSGRVPTTHILKPPGDVYEGYAENEHLCLALSRAIGLPTAASEVIRFGSELVFCVERYDRARTDAGFVLLHQEDFCQTLGTRPAFKYQNEGGPGICDLADVLRRHSTKPTQDRDTLYLALAFNWFIAGIDAHAKNYSLLLGARGVVGLAPLYDLSSAHP